ncbi:MAG: hypothetical protein LBK01_01315 [Burkholderiaceae bacterium]|nr:hypothetical protein [Burkholderiaceae bacterium]
MIVKTTDRELAHKVRLWGEIDSAREQRGRVESKHYPHFSKIKIMPAWRCQ